LTEAIKTKAIHKVLVNVKVESFELRIVSMILDPMVIAATHVLPTGKGSSFIYMVLARLKGIQLHNTNITHLVAKYEVEVTTLCAKVAFLAKSKSC